MRLHLSRNTHHAPRTPRPSQSGVALVITLLLLSIITFMAVTFLVVSRSQKGSVVTETDQATARLAADEALERAKAELLAAIMGSTNEFNYGLLVSTNYINSAGFTSGNANPLNVNYDYKVGGSPITSATDREQNIANLLYNPRPPVFVVINGPSSNFYDFRFYLDLNRNGRYDTNGLLPVIGGNGLPTGATNFFVGDPEWIGSLERPEFNHSADNQFVNRYAYIAIPAGNTLDLNSVHNYGKSSLIPANANAVWPDGFLRNQGVLSSEINLAAFLVDLNTNQWPGPDQAGVNPLSYQYFPMNSGAANTGLAADDAAALLRYRYGNTNMLNSLASVSRLFPFPSGVNSFASNSIDAYSEGPVMLGTSWPPAGTPDPNPTRVNFPWSGADNPNHFFTTQDLFDKSKTALNFVAGYPSVTDCLLAAGSATNSYDRYTFYRLLSQLGSDSAPEPAGKMNLNYCNVDIYGNVVPGMATNFIPWQPTNFFVNAAIRLLANAGFTVGDPRYATNILVTNYVNGALVTKFQIQIWPTNFYTPNVHRLLQLAANIYDASTNRVINGVVMTNVPSVFRPVFKYVPASDRVFISGYEEVLVATGPGSFLSQNPFDLTLLRDRQNATKAVQPAFWGIPLVIGAKKGLPNFNRFALQTQVQVTRKLQFHRPGTSNTADVNELDQMFVVGITNSFAVQAWNSYKTPFPRSLRVIVMSDMTVALTNRDTGHLLNPATWIYVSPVVATDLTANAWSPYNPGTPKYSFQFPLASGPGVPFTNQMFLSNATYLANSDTFVPLSGVFERTPGTSNLYVPHWQVTMRNRIRYALVDTSVSPTRIVDYVNLDSTEDPLQIDYALQSDGPCGGSYTPSPSNGGMWCTNRLGGVNSVSVPTFGIMNQLEASLGHTQPDWKQSLNEFSGSISDQTAFFQGQFTPGYLRQSNTFAAPYQPFRIIYKVTDWQANDPLVHYTIGDLKNLQNTKPFVLGDPTPSDTDLPLNKAIWKVNHRYEPWGGNPDVQSVTVPLYELRVKDPVAAIQGRSDYWDFPTNKFPNIGWLGRVHRGTPWQTVYLKSPGIDLQSWTNWTGNSQWITNFGQLSTNLLALYFPRHYYPGTSNEIGTGLEAYLSMPTNDWHVLDLFTTALNDNATRGQLSINQTNLAAWSAVLSGVVVLTNTPWVDASGNPYQDANGNPLPAPLTVQPAGVYDPLNTNTWPPLVRIVNGINRTRASAYAVGNNVFPVFRNYSFQSLGDILAVPELTVASPFRNLNSVDPTTDPNYALSDAVCERIPQQILGLLKCDHTPRFVVYSFGQALRPADHSLVTSGLFTRLCTNYQIMAESATRAVLRVDGAPTNSHIVIESYNVLPPD